MPTLAIRQSSWQELRENQRQLMKWAFQKLELGQPALYEAPGGALWFIFDDHKLDLLMFARLGTLANEVASLPNGWRPPTIGTGQNRRVDRAAVEAEAISRVQAVIVLPDDIVYPAHDPNPQRTTLVANNAPSAMDGWDAIPVDWTVAL